MNPSLPRKTSPDPVSEMHDFCFTILYRLLLVGGGIFGYFRKWNTTSLFEGLGIGLVLTVASNLSLQDKTCSNS